MDNVISFKKGTPYRLAIDLGSNSLGWAIFVLAENTPFDFIDAGVRLFSDSRDPQDGLSLGSKRREPRSARRRRDRGIQRTKKLFSRLQKYKLLPDSKSEQKQLERLDPYLLRAKAVSERLSLQEVGRIFIHLNQRRGFKSNRKADGKNNDASAMGTAINTTKEQIVSQGCLTYGEWLYKTRIANRSHKHPQEWQHLRARSHSVKNKNHWEFLADRALIEEEFDAIWAHQRKFYPEILTDEAKTQIGTETIFHQRPLKPAIVGKCSLHRPLNPKDRENRLHISDPVAQAFRIYSTLNNLQMIFDYNDKRSLTLEERAKILKNLFWKKHITFKELRKILGFEDVKFNLETDNNDKIIGHSTNAIMADKKRFGETWATLSIETQQNIINLWLEESDENTLINEFMNYGLTYEQAKEAANALLEEGHLRLGITATTKILAELEKEMITYAEAGKRAGYSMREEDDGEVMDKLPYYGQVLSRYTQAVTSNSANPEELEYGKIANPSVHVALNQLRRVINKLIVVYGKPTEIVLEIGRDLKLGGEEKKKLEKENFKNKKDNERIDGELAQLGITSNRENRIRYKLWEELSSNVLVKHCPYSGVQISAHDIFSPRFEVDHILPFSRTLDDGVGNLVLSLREANRAKGNLTPFEAAERGLFNAWGGVEALIQRSQQLTHKGKQKRFLPDAMKHFEGENKDFLARQLNDTRYIARVSQIYCKQILDNRSNLWAVTGQLTAMLRAKWGFNNLLGKEDNKKYRDDNRHHAVDAAVIGLVDRSLLQRVATLNARQGKDIAKRVIADEPPIPNLFTKLSKRLETLIPSHKPDHGTGGQLFKETAYGLISPEKNEGFNLVTRKPLTAIDELKKIEQIRDRRIRDEVKELWDECYGDKKQFALMLMEYAQAKNIRKVRYLDKNESARPIANRQTGQIYKALVPDSNHHVDIIEHPNGKWEGIITALVDSQNLGIGSTPQWQLDHLQAKFIARLHKGDIVRFKNKDGVFGFYKVIKIQKDRLVCMQNTDARTQDEAKKTGGHYNASYPSLKEKHATLIFIDEIGRFKLA